MEKQKLNHIDQAWALLFARLVLGLIFFMAGVYKVFKLGPLEHARKYFLPYADTFLPTWSLWATGVVIPFIELVAGGLVNGRPAHPRGSCLSGFRLSHCDVRS